MFEKTFSMPLILNPFKKIFHIRIVKCLSCRALRDTKFDLRANLKKSLFSYVCNIAVGQSLHRRDPELISQLQELTCLNTKGNQSRKAALPGPA